MAATTTTLAGNISASVSQLALTAYTAPTTGGNLSTKSLLKIDDEIMLITDATLSPTLGVVRGYMGTIAAAHYQYASAVYGVPFDMQTSKGPTQASASFANPAIAQNVQEVTATGATGSTAGVITQAGPAFLNVTGTSGTGINLPYAAAGATYTIKNNSTGVLKIYSVGATINGTTGTTAVSITATGNLLALASCATAGAWQVWGNT